MPDNLVQVQNYRMGMEIIVTASAHKSIMRPDSERDRWIGPWRLVDGQWEREYAPGVHLREPEADYPQRFWFLGPVVAEDRDAYLVRTQIAAVQRRLHAAADGLHAAADELGVLGVGIRAVNRWVGPAGAWSDPANWSEGTVPGAGSDVALEAVPSAP